MSRRLKLPPLTVRYSDLNTEHLHVTDYEDNKYTPSQKAGFVTYKGQSLQIQSPDLLLFTYGIPKEDPKYHKTDKDRLYLKIPEDVNNPKCIEFFKKMESIDAYFGSDEFKTSKMGRSAKYYKYTPIVRSVIVEDDDEGDEVEDKRKEKNAKPRYIKVKIDNDYETSNVLTKCFVKDGNERIQVADIVTIDDLMKYVRYNSHVRVLISVVKTYMSKNKSNNSEYKNYGVTIKLSQVLCDPRPIQINERNDACNIVESDEDNS